MEKFTNPKLEKLFEALADLYPTSMGWGGQYEEDDDVIVFSVRLLDPDKNISTPQTVWLSAKSATILGEYEGRCAEDETITFSFTDFKE